jgi:hypothetical protein
MGSGVARPLRVGTRQLLDDAPGCDADHVARDAEREQ